MHRLGTSSTSLLLFKGALLVLLSLLLPSCQFESPLSPLECSSDDDCDEGLSCISSYCVAQPIIDDDISEEPDSLEDITEEDSGPRCFGDQQLCGGECVDTHYDPQNCGGCNQACATGLTCLEGRCTLLCSEGTERCGNACRDLQTDPDHCGGCDLSCGAGELCTDGTCQLWCSKGLTKIGDECVDTMTDPRFCGEDPQECGDEELCIGGICTKNCPPGYDEVEGTCRDPLNDPLYCGNDPESSPAPCDGPSENGEAICIDGSCSIRCFSNYTRCKDKCVDPSTPCETQ